MTSRANPARRHSWWVPLPDAWYWLISAGSAAFAVTYAVREDWLGIITPLAFGATFFVIPRLLDSTYAVGWMAAVSKVDGLLAGTATWDDERQSLVPLIADIVRVAIYVDLTSAKPHRREYEKRMAALVRELAQMEDPTREQIAELYRRYRSSHE